MLRDVPIAQDELIEFQFPDDIGEIAMWEIVGIFFKLLKLGALIVSFSLKAGCDVIERIYPKRVLSFGVKFSVDHLIHWRGNQWLLIHEL